MALPRLTPLALIWNKGEYRAALLIMILTSLGTSSGIPLTSLYLVNDLHAGLATAALLPVSTALPGLLLGVLIGRRSDRWRSRLPFLRIGTAWVATGWLGLALAPSPWSALAAGALFLSLGGVLTGQVFAALHDVMERDGEPQAGLINTLIRTGWSFGFVFGPLVGSTLGSHVSFRAAFATSACLYIMCLIPMPGIGAAAPQAVRDPGEQGRGSRAGLPLLAFTALSALVISGQAIKNTYLPIDVTAHLRGSVGTYGTIVAISPIVELVVMPLSGVLAQRIGIAKLMAVGLAMAAVEYLVLAGSNMLWQLYATQAMDACVVAVVMGLGVTYAQRLSPGRAGTANGIFFSSFNVAFILGGLIGSAGVPLLGVPHIFLIPSVLCAAACALFLCLDRVAQSPGSGRPRVRGAAGEARATPVMGAWTDRQPRSGFHEATSTES